MPESRVEEVYKVNKHSLHNLSDEIVDEDDESEDEDDGGYTVLRKWKWTGTVGLWFAGGHLDWRYSWVQRTKARRGSTVRCLVEALPSQSAQD